MRSIRHLIAGWLPKAHFHLSWESSKVLRVNDVKFFVTSDNRELRSVESSEDYFLLGKSPAMIERITKLGMGRVRLNKIFEMGIFKGGSAVLYDQLFGPEKLVAIDRMIEPVDTLSRYIVERGKSLSLKPFYGVNQESSNIVGPILASEFPDRDIDLVVDDASHLYHQTRSAFNTCFPFLKAGGSYVIEDWGWAHWPGDFWQHNTELGEEPALSNLLIELFMLAASRPDLVVEISIADNLIILTKGNGKHPFNGFNISDNYLLRGKEFAPWL